LDNQRRRRGGREEGENALPKIATFAPFCTRSTPRIVDVHTPLTFVDSPTYRDSKATGCLFPRLNTNAGATVEEQG
jgi:hypothetical protein